MPRQSENLESQIRKSGSGFVELFNLNRLMQTVGNIVAEAKDKEEMLQLTINALSIFTGSGSGNVFLRDDIHQNIFRCSDIHYAGQGDLSRESHKQASLNVYSESSPLIKHMTAHPTSFIDRSGPQASFRILIPLVSRGKLFGFFELAASGEVEEPSLHLTQVFYQIGYRIGSVLDSFATSEELNKFFLAVEYSTDHIMITDSNAVILHINKAAEQTTGYSREELIGQKPSLWGGNMDKEFYKNMWDTIKVKKQPFFGELNNTRKGGIPYIAALSIAPILDKDGEVKFFVGIERNITKEKEIDRMKTEFVSIASHQLRTPLTGLNWLIEILVRKGGENLNSRQKGYLEDMKRSIERMLELVNDLLNVSRLETGKIQIEPKPIRLSDFVRGIIDDARALAKERGCRVTFKKPSRKLPEISIDPALMRQVVYNLITNAIQYSPAKRGEILVQLKKEDTRYLISVKDNGIGIPQEVQPMIFGKFFRADNAKQQRQGGSGLGLYISKMIINEMGGKIWFESPAPGRDKEENKGTTFYVEFPIKSETKTGLVKPVTHAG